MTFSNNTQLADLNRAGGSGDPVSQHLFYGVKGPNEVFSYISFRRFRYYGILTNNALLLKYLERFLESAFHKTCFRAPLEEKYSFTLLNLSK